MSRMLEVPDSLYHDLEEAASASGTTPVGWLAANVPKAETDPAAGAPRSLADMMEGLIGTFESATDENLSGNHSEIFAEILQQKHREGTL